MILKELIQAVKMSNYYLEKQNLGIQNNQFYTIMNAKKTIENYAEKVYCQDYFCVVKLMRDIKDICWIYYKNRHYQLKVVYNNFENQDEVIFFNYHQQLYLIILNFIRLTVKIQQLGNIIIKLTLVNKNSIQFNLINTKVNYQMDYKVKDAIYNFEDHQLNQLNHVLQYIQFLAQDLCQEEKRDQISIEFS